MREWTDSITEIGEEEQSINSYSEIDPEHLSTDSTEEIDQETIVQSKVFWKTRQIALHQNDKESYVWLTIKELILHGAFLTLFVIFCYALYSHETYEFNQEISSLFTNSSFTMSSMDDTESSLKFGNIIIMEQFWKYSRKILCEKVYETQVIGEKSDNSSTSNTFHRGKFLFRPKARQVRVKEGECNIRTQFQGLFHDCYAPYDIKYEDKSSFGPKNGTSWMYSDETVTQEREYTSKIAHYGAGGYCFEFPSDKKDAKELLIDLEYNTWLDRGTRAVFIDFTFYNDDIDVICLAKLVFEFPAWGGIIPSSLFLTIKLHQFTSKVMYIIIIVFIIYFMVEEIFEILYFRLDYIKIFWNYVDFGTVVIGWCIFGLAVAIGFQESSLELSEGIPANMTDYRFANKLVTMHVILIKLTVVMCCLIYIKIIKYMDLNKSMTYIYLCMELWFIAIGRYLWEMSIAVVAFAMFGYCVFGQQVKEFSTIYDTFCSTFSVLTGDFQSLELPGETTFILFWSYVFKYAAVIVLCRMLLMISLYAHFTVNAKELLGDRKIYVCDKVSIFVEDLLQRVGLKKWAKRMRRDRLNHRYQDRQAVRQFEDILLHGTKYSEPTAIQYSTEYMLLVMNMNELESSLENIQDKCDFVKVRLSAIRSLFPTNYAEDVHHD